QRGAHVLMPLQRKLDPATRGSHFLTTFARLKRGIAVERAAAEMRALGMELAAWTLRVFVVLAGNQLPRAAAIVIDARVLAFTAVTSVGVGVVCGLWPLILLRMRELASAVREGDTRTGSGAGKRFG